MHVAKVGEAALRGVWWHASPNHVQIIGILLSQPCSNYYYLLLYCCYCNYYYIISGWVQRLCCYNMKLQSWFLYYLLKPVSTVYYTNTVIYDAMLYYAILYYIMLYSTLPCYAMLCCAMLRYILHRYTKLYSAMLRYTTLYHAMLCHTTLHYTAPH